MSDPAWDARARARQVARIERLILLRAGDVHGLDDVPATDLRALHDQISEAYFAPGRDLLAKVAGLAKVLPATVAGKFAERFLPPAQGARSAEMLEPTKAGDLATKVSVRYLADLSLELDPTRSRAILQAVPPRRVGDVAAELFARKEYAAVAELAGSVTRGGLASAIDIAAGRDLVALVPLLDWNDDIVAVVDAMPDAKIDALISAARSAHQDIDEIAAALPTRARERLRTRLAARPGD